MRLVERHETRGTTCVVVLADDSLLHGLMEIRTRLADTNLGGTVLILDLSRLERLSSSTLAAMLWARRTCYARGGQVVLRSPNRQCLYLLTRTGLDTLFDIRTGSAAGRRGRLDAEVASR